MTYRLVIPGQPPNSTVAPGSSSQVLMSNATPATTWTTISGDVTVSATGVTTVGQLQGTIVLSGTPSAGQVLTATSSTAADWATPSGGSGITQLTGDVTAGPGSGSQAATVVNVHGVSYPATPSTNTVPVVTGSNTVTYQAIANAQISATAAIAVSKLAIGTADQLLDTNHGATTAEWFTLGGDATFASHNLTVVALQGNAVKAQTLGAGQDQYVLTWNNSTTNWQALPNSGGSGITQLTGDVTAGPGSGSQAATVVKINGTSVPATPTANQVLVASSGTTATWATIVDANVSASAAIAVSKLASGTSAQILQNNGTPTPTWTTVSGDVSITNAGVTTVGAIQGNTVTAGALTKGQFFVATTTSNWAATTLSGDLTESGTTAGQVTVSKINTATVPAAGALTTGNVLQVTGASALSYAAVNLAGGANFVTGTLPTGNQAAQSLTLIGDATGSGTTTSTTTTVAKINGATVPAAGSLTTGNGLYVTGASALSYSALNLAGGTNYVTGNLPVSNVAPGTSAQILMSNGTPATTWTTVSGDVSITNAGVTTVGAIQGNTVTAGALTKGQFFVASSTTNWAATTLSGDVSESATTAGKLTVTALQGNAVKAQTLGAGQDQYVLTWVNANNDWEAQVNSGGSGITQLTGDVTAGPGSGSQAATVAKIQGVAISGTPSTGQVLTATSSSAADWQTPSGGSGSATFIAVNQTAHGFTTGQAVYFNGSTWALAEANASTTLAFGVVSVVDANNFNLYVAGEITGLSGLTAGQYYYVSDTSAGTLQTNEPTSSSSFSNPLLFALTTTIGIVLPYRPSGISSSLYGTYANRPASAPAGSIYTSSDGHVQFVYTGSTWAPVLNGTIGTQPPAAASFSTHINWGGGTSLTDSEGTLFFTDQTSGGNENDHSAVLNTAGSTYTVIAGFKPLLTLAANSGAGIVLTDGTKLIKFWVAYVQTSNGQPITIQIVTLSNSTTFVANLVTTGIPLGTNSTIWFKIVNNATNRLYSYSTDGINWNQIFSHASGTFLTETQYGMVIAPLNSGGCAMTLESWTTSSP